MHDNEDPQREKPEARLLRLMKEAPRSPNSDAQTFDVSGDGNFVAGGDLNVNFGAPPRPRVTAKTGDGVIDAAQKADLTKRLKQWLSARNVIRRDTMSIAAAWAALNAAVGVNSYHEITPDKLPLAKQWITRQRAILTSMKSAPAKMESFRGDAIKAIKVRSKQLGDLHFYVPHISKTFGAESLTQLSDRQLQEVRAWIFGQRKR